MSIRQLHDYFQQRYGPMPVVVHHSLITEDSQGEDMERNEQIKHAIMVLDKDIKYYETTMPRESQFLRGYKKAAEVAKWYLKPVLIPEPQPGEVWIVEIQDNNPVGFLKRRTVRREDGRWQGFDGDIYYDDAVRYAVTPITKLIPEEIA